jgi:carbonic anhydrase
MIAGAVIGIARPLPRWLDTTPVRRAPTRLTPEEAIRELVAGNQRFVAGRLTSTGSDLTVLRQRTIEKQEPFAAILGCADSRVPVELVFDQSIGRLFVTRVAGNVATPDVIASLEYAVAELHVSALLVLGHQSCGAVKAAIKGEDVPGQISSLYPPLRPAVELGKGNVEATVDANARLQAELLRTSSTVVRDALSKGAIKVISGVYDLASGKVTFI